ncbi:hypothetical protein KBC03_08130 [Patescibacteria group bacterium]|nr:hypothetical protein [Patescibacteria group bacterium]
MEQQANKILTEKIKPTVRRIEEIEQELKISPEKRVSKLLISSMGP